MAFEWSDELSVGIPDIDRQHKELLNKIKELREACREGRGKELIDEMMAFLERYINDHFSCEERYMKEFNYPQMVFHVKEHTDFTKRYLELRDELRKRGWRLYTTLETKDLLGLWWINHISKVDRELGRFLKDQKYTSKRS